MADLSIDDPQVAGGVAGLYMGMISGARWGLMTIPIPVVGPLLGAVAGGVIGGKAGRFTGGAFGRVVELATNGVSALAGKVSAVTKSDTVAASPPAGTTS